MSTERSRPSIGEIAALYRDGSTIAQVADHVGYSSSWVYNQLVAASVERRSSAAGPKRANRRRPSIGEITDLYRQGWSLAQIGAHVGYSGSWVAKQLTVTGVDRRPSASTAGSRRLDAAAEADMVRHLCSLYLDEQLSLVEIGRRFDRSPWWVKDRLTRWRSRETRTLCMGSRSPTCCGRWRRSEQSACIGQTRSSTK